MNDEYVIQVDPETDIEIGPVSRKKAHEEGICHRGGFVLIFNPKEEIYLTRRSFQKKLFPGHNDFACSFHTKHGQSNRKAAKVELEEETGITEIRPNYLNKFLLDTKMGSLREYGWMSVYMIHYDGEIKLDPTEAFEGRYYPLPEADKIIKSQNAAPWLPESWEIYKQYKNTI